VSLGHKLHPHIVEAFDLLQEECGEVVQARSKLRRGRDEGDFMPPKRRPNGPDNLTDMKTEIMDLMVLIDYLREKHNLISAEEYAAYRPIKEERLARYTNIFEPVGSPDWIDRLDPDFTTDPDYRAAHGLGFDEDHSVGIATHRGSIKRSHAAEGRNFVD
jgi:NTP pyrophosphatase (non-canonical NTP hydrolase)